jgi:nicotinamidase-related amidase
MKAVIFIDIQNDFIDGALLNEKAIEVTPKIVDFAKECVENGCKLYATRDTHEKTKMIYHFEGDKQVDEPISGYLSTLEGKKLPVEHCIEGTDGWMIDNRLMEVLDGKCTFVNKPTFGSFDLAEIISEDFENKALNEIVLCGFVTDICLLSNALLLRAKFPNTKITVMKDLCAGTTNENHEAALKVMQSCQIDVV